MFRRKVDHFFDFFLRPQPRALPPAVSMQCGTNVTRWFIAVAAALLQVSFDGISTWSIVLGTYSWVRILKLRFESVEIH